MIRKRVFSLMMVVILVFFCVRPVPVQASSVVVPSAESAESLMVLLDLLINAMMAGGAAESFSDYNSEMDLLEAFFNFAHDVVMPGAPNYDSLVVLTPDGESITLGDLENGLEDGTVSLPNEQQWGQYRVGFGDDFLSILEAWEGRGGGIGDGGEPEDPKDPEFSKIKTLLFNSAFLTMVSDFVTDLWNGNVEGVAPETFLNIVEYNWSGEYEMLGGNYIFTGNMTEEWPESTRGDAIHFLKIAIDQNISGMPAIVYSTNTDGSRLFSFYKYNNEINELRLSFRSYGYNIAGQLLGTYNNSYLSSWEIKPEHVVFDYNFNIPVFGTYEAMESFFKTGDESGILNGLCYDFPALAKSIPDVFSPMASMQLSPSALQRTYTNMKTAYQTQIKPRPKTDPQTDTKTYTDTMTDTIVSTLPDVQPSPDPGESGGTNTDTDVNVDDYKRDLRMIFPFCLPFDFIHLLQAFDAEPKAPAFDIPFVVPALNINMTVTLDMSFLNPVMEVWRFGEKVSFVFLLIFVTSKVIRW